MTRRIDLHTHSSLSDGTDTPAELVRKAAAADLDVVALTDHDLVDGWEEATAAGEEYGIEVVCGIEWSTTNEGEGQHLLAYGFDPAHPEVQRLLARAGTSRDGRYPRMRALLKAEGYPVTDEEVRTFGRPEGTPSRKHLAMTVAAKYPHKFASDAAVFDALLRPGRPAYVERDRPTIEDTIRLMTAAGGVTVLAHPRDAKRTATGRGVGDERIAALTAVGLTGIEVDHRTHSDADRAALRALAADLDLVITGSSDHHGTNKVDHDLGCHVTDPEQFDRLIRSR